MSNNAKLLIFPTSSNIILYPSYIPLFNSYSVHNVMSVLLVMHAPPSHMTIPIVPEDICTVLLIWWLLDACAVLFVHAVHSPPWPWSHDHCTWRCLHCSFQNLMSFWVPVADHEMKARTWWLGVGFRACRWDESWQLKKLCRLGCQLSHQSQQDSAVQVSTVFHST